eukprot:CAMPEP_0172727924 /NCGR_PEP_ID=MMETSP1074-20121228/91953_1 /TAXON_ID=2916 /ORGANISM="Ceratium fusus, Strain PA161109" /LENGTH=44 /DNA_ID= /DNA_START= /DNA_END= /DNA_ORIENTATION=
MTPHPQPPSHHMPTQATHATERVVTRCVECKQKCSNASCDPRYP